jgi:hypothetical protein
MRKTRRRQSTMEKTFSPEDRKLVDPPAPTTNPGTFKRWIKARLDAYERVFIVLATVLTISFLIAVYAVTTL